MSAITSPEDPDLFLSLEDLELCARGIVEGTMLGVHRSPFTGLSSEFETHREYTTGDDLRHVNWKLWARTDKMFVKQYRSDTNFQLHLAVDASGSMGTGNGPSRKWAWASRAAAALAFVALTNRDAAGLALVRDGIAAQVPAKVAAGQLQRILAELSAGAPQGRADTAEGLAEVVHLTARRGLVIYFGDLFDDPERTLRALATLRHRGHEVSVFHVLDPWEVELPKEGHYEFTDLETGEKLKVDTPALRDAYAEKVARWRHDLRAQCEAEGISYALSRTDSPIRDVLLDFLATRGRV